ncbi:MAG TPA: amidohydrolase family protein [Aggregatilineales bacterium]|nr:amidohydrolase family protein [Aggregatilineales bacterium]
MEHVDKIIKDGVVLTMNSAFDKFVDGAVAVRGDAIVAVGEAADIIQRYEADEVVSCPDQIIMPGLVNAHTHVPMTLLRGVADDLRLDVWLMGYVMPTEQEFVNPQFCRLGTTLACAEMIRSGITMFADMYYFESDVAEATAKAGMRGVLGQSILKFPTPDADSFDESLAYTRKFIEQWKGHPLIVPAVAPHAPYTCTDEILSACAVLAREYDVPLLIHLAETKLEVENSRTEFGMPVIPRVKKLEVLNAKTLAAHCVHVDSGEIRTLFNHNTGVAHCPTSNLKLASGIAPVKEMLERELNVGIGTDGPASNNDLDMFEEMRLAAILAKGATNDPVVLPAKQALTMATRLGAQAMHQGSLTGSLEVGKRADLIAVDRHTLHSSPAFERDRDSIYSQIVYATKSTDVRHVMVNGAWLMRDRALLTIDVESTLKEAQAVARKIDLFLMAREGNVLNKLIAIGGVAQTESFEIQVKARVDDPDVLNPLFSDSRVEVVKQNHYRQYDSYFLFDEESQGRVRYREDDMINDQGQVENVRTRLTFTSPTKEREFDESVLLSRSEFIAPADRPQRFYREYFRPTHEYEIQKERRRWHIHYKGVLFYVNLDTLTHPQNDGIFMEIKTQTWSKRDAEYKATLIAEILVDILGLTPDKRVRKEYLEFALQPG